jgi:cyclopropane-fatty-acyl-phospholipid synthase
MTEKNNNKNYDFTSRMARDAVHKLFSQLKHGELKIIDESGETLYGDSASSDRLKAEMNIKSPAAYREIFFSGSLGAAESYVNKQWTTPSLELVNVIQVFVQNMKIINSMDSGLARFFTTMLRITYRLFEKNTEEGSRKEYFCSL